MVTVLQGEYYNWSDAPSLKGYIPPPPPVEDSHGISLPLQSSLSDRGGFKITPNFACNLISTTKSSSCTATRADLRASNKSTVLATTTFVGDVATFTPYALTSGTTYYVVAWSSGTNYNFMYMNVLQSYPIVCTNITYRGSLSQFTDTNVAYNLTSITTQRIV